MYCLTYSVYIIIGKCVYYSFSVAVSDMMLFDQSDDSDIASDDTISFEEGDNKKEEEEETNDEEGEMNEKKDRKKVVKNLTPITCIAVDPGIVHHAIIKMSLSGFEYRQDPITRVMVKIPKVKIHNWEHWSLKHKITYRGDGEWKLKTNKYNGDGTSTDDRIAWGENLANFVSSSDWLFDKDSEDKLVPLVTEVQCGYVKNEEVDAYTIAHMLPCAIKTVDIIKGLGSGRPIVNSAKKYGIPSDGSLSYSERKRKSDDVTYNVLNVTNHRNEVNYLNLTLLAMKRDSIPRVKTDDLSDAFTLGLEYLAREWELREYNEDNSIKLEEDPVRVTIFDEEEDVKLLTQKQRVRRKPKNKKTDKDDDNDNDETSNQKKTPVKRKTANKRKKGEQYEEEEVEEEFLVDRKKKKFET